MAKKKAEGKSKGGERDITESPKSGLGDAAHTVVKAGLSAIPVVGGPAAELFSAIVIPPLSRRRDEWVVSLAEALKKLEKRVEGFKLKELSENETFITTVTHATQAAIRNHQEEKLEALRNAVLNSVLPNPPDEDLQLMFLSFIDAFTSWHLRILEFFDNPKGWGERHDVVFEESWMGSRSGLLEKAYPQLVEHRDLYTQIVADLFSKGLISTGSISGNVTGSGEFDSLTTRMGKQFLEFITSPLNEGPA